MVHSARQPKRAAPPHRRSAPYRPPRRARTDKIVLGVVLALLLLLAAVGLTAVLLTSGRGRQRTGADVLPSLFVQKQDLLDACPPYETRGFDAPETFTMGGEVYTQGFTLDATLGLFTNVDGFAFFNLGGKYRTLTFDLGHVDGTQLRDAAVTIYLDDEPVQTIEAKADALPQSVTIDLNYADQLQIWVRSNALDENRWGFANAAVW